MPTKEGDRWREYDVDRRITVAVAITIAAGKLRLKKQKNRGENFYANFKHGIFLTQEVLDALIRMGPAEAMREAGEA